MTPLDDEILQRFHDGDLPPAEAAVVRSAIERDPDARARLAQLRLLSALVRDAFAQASSEALEAPSGSARDADAMFARIEAEVFGGAQAEPRRSELRAVPRPASDGTRTRSADAARRRTVVVPMFASLAVAAAALLVYLAPQRGRGPRDVDEASDVATHLAPSGSQIDDVDFGSSTGTVFEVDNGGVAAAVVWISDDEEGP